MSIITVQKLYVAINNKYFLYIVQQKVTMNFYVCYTYAQKKKKIKKSKSHKSSANPQELSSSNTFHLSHMAFQYSTVHVQWQRELL